MIYYFLRYRSVPMIACTVDHRCLLKKSAGDTYKGTALKNRSGSGDACIADLILNLRMALTNTFLDGVVRNQLQTDLESENVCGYWTIDGVSITFFCITCGLEWNSL